MTGGERLPKIMTVGLMVWRESGMLTPVLGLCHSSPSIDPVPDEIALE
jgi:hypothetical protein